MIQQLISRCKSPVSSIHKLCKATELLQNEAGRQILAANATHWNSMLALLEAISKVENEQEGVLLYAAEIVGSVVHLTAKDFTTIQLLLQPTTNATVRLEAESVPTSNLVEKALEKDMQIWVSSV